MGELAKAEERGPVEQWLHTLEEPYYHGGRVAGLRMLPPNVLTEILEDANSRPGSKMAAAAAGAIMGRFPAVKLHDPVEFARGMAELMQDYHPRAIRQAVKWVPRKVDYLTLKAVTDILDKFQTPYNRAAHLATQQLRAHREDGHGPKEIHQANTR